MCDANPGNAVIISGSGARPNVNGLQRFTRRNIGRTSFYEREGLYIYAARTITLPALHGASDAFEAKQGLLSRFEVEGILALLSNSIKNLKMHFELRKVKDSSIQSFERKTLNLDRDFSYCFSSRRCTTLFV